MQANAKKRSADDDKDEDQRQVEAENAAAMEAILETVGGDHDEVNDADDAEGSGEELGET